jgi:hypothetical protein
VEHHLQEAQRRAEAQGHLNMSMRGLQASQVGALGELVALEYMTLLGVEYEEVFNTKYDIEFVNENTKWKLEVKTKERTVAPRDYYDCTAPLYNKSHQTPDYYLFVSLKSTGKSDDISRFTDAYILGSMSSYEFSQRAQLWTKDQTDTSNGWVPTVDCLNVQISELVPPRTLTLTPSK